MRPVILFGLAALACLAPSAKANLMVIGTTGLIDPSTVTVNTGNILTATMFDLTDWTAFGGQSGIFAGLGLRNFGPVSFNIGTPSSFTFFDSEFGRFTGINIAGTSMTPLSISFNFNGFWTPGTFGGVTGGPFAALLNINFSQAGGPGSPTITATGSVAVSTEAAIPEPSSVVLSLTGIAAGLVLFRLRRRRQNLQTAHAATV